ncbi:Reverse transcriptase domain-containing protein, partial [Aphis craccivora]
MIQSWICLNIPLLVTTSGESQGSHLLVLFISIFVNSAKYMIQHCRLLFNTDDVKSDIFKLLSWCETLILILNFDKCRSMFYNSVTSAVFYGFHLIDKLYWSPIS